MTDFQKALSALQPTDLSFLPKITPHAQSPQNTPPRKRRRRTPNPGAGADNSNLKEISSSDAAPVPVTSDGVAAKNATVEPSHARQHIDHEWPPVGTIVSGNYFGTVYRAQVVKANKKLKSGRQLKLLDGPAKGKRFDSFTGALLDATEKQRKKSNLGRKQASNGWGFWKQEAPAGTAAADPNAA